MAMELATDSNHESLLLWSSMTEVAAALSEATGKPIRYVDVPPDAARAAQIAAGMPAYLADGLAELFAERRKGKEATVSQVIQTIFKRLPLSFADFARRHAAVFRARTAGSQGLKDLPALIA